VQLLNVKTENILNRKRRCLFTPSYNMEV